MESAVWPSAAATAVTLDEMGRQQPSSLVWPTLGTASFHAPMQSLLNLLQRLMLRDGPVQPILCGCGILLACGCGIFRGQAGLCLLTCACWPCEDQGHNSMLLSRVLCLAQQGWGCLVGQSQPVACFQTPQCKVAHSGPLRMCAFCHTDLASCMQLQPIPLGAAVWHH